MILHIQGDVWQTQCEAIVIPVNTVGAMGAGLAKQAAQRFPGCITLYRHECGMGVLGFPGNAARITLEGTRPILLGVTTKRHWKDPSELDWIKSGVTNLVDLVAIRQIESCAIPALGCGYGQLNWDDVLPLIKEACKKLPDVRWEIYEPSL